MSSMRFFPWHGGLPEQVPLSDGHAAHSTGGRSRGRKAEEQHLFAPRSLDRTSGEYGSNSKLDWREPSSAAARCPLPASQLRTLFLVGMADDCTHMHLFPTFLSPTREVRVLSRARRGREARRRRRGLAECDGLRTT